MDRPQNLDDLKNRIATEIRNMMFNKNVVVNSISAKMQVWGN